MNSYELVKHAIEFKCPKVTPLRFAACGLSDTHELTSLDDKTRNLLGSAKTIEDEWRCVWEMTEIHNSGQVKVHPLADWTAMRNYVFPDPNEEWRYQRIPEELAGVTDKYILCYDHFSLFERTWTLHGFAKTLEDFYLEPDKMHDLVERVLEYHLGIAYNLGKRFKGKIHGVWLTDDLGSQSGTLMSVPMWCSFFKERYRKLIGAFHDAGMHVWLHSDGKINDLIEHFIDVRLDVINLMQPVLVGIDDIAHKYVGRICIEACVDIQKTLQHGTDDIVRETKEILRKWQTPKGGLIMSDYGFGGDLGLTVDKKQVVFSALMTEQAARFEAVPACPSGSA